MFTAPIFSLKLVFKEIKSVKFSFKYFFLFSFIDLHKPIVKVLPGSQPREGNLAILECVALGSHPMNYTWFRNSIALAEASNIFTIFNVKRNDSGEYKCSASNDFGNATSDSVTVAVACKYIFHVLVKP